MKGTMQVIHASKHFDKSVQELYDAWINADKLKQWWEPAGNKLVNVKNEVKEGGNLTNEFETKEGKKAFTITGVYESVVPASKLAYTWNWKMPGNVDAKENHFKLTVTFAGDANSSSIHITQAELDNNEAMHPTFNGWEEALGKACAFFKYLVKH